MNRKNDEHPPQTAGPHAAGTGSSGIPPLSWEWMTESARIKGTKIKERFGNKKTESLL
jgi:hypothetical protein